ncbi:dihydrofolate reductase [Arenibacter sp. 6A1]|uniref:dihydrofolate reductase family protein n=1 Tax=Arenibacter sp. 6A1 TaxID=2720391 RepID=UPI0014454594|nr:dihydrofolate reductase family protein [Arenibacter sp. 6A1]NKI25493.1 dihydrofolate reductase [Arenibacter sp. 6A1]
MRKLVLYISMSVDGYLATKDDDLSWLSIVEKEGEDYGYHDFYKDVDTYIVGKTTYDTILKLTGGKLPQAENLDCYVITRQNIADKENVTFYNGDIENLIHKLKSEEGKNIVCDGGGQIVKLLMEKNLIDEYIISVIPVFLGEGKRLFIGGIDTINLKALSSKSFDTGLVQLHYSKQ